jgi:hypothetical protein
MPTLAEAHRPTKPPRINSEEVLQIFIAAASEESTAGDRIVPRAPEFPRAVIRNSKGQISSAPLTPDSDFWQSNWEGTKPSPELIARWFAAQYRSISVCTGNRERVEALAGWRKQRVSERKDAGYFVRATLPVLDAAGTHALIVYSTVAVDGRLDGHTHMLLLARSGGRWQKIGTGFISVI